MTSIRMFRYQGLSMWPLFQDGDLLELTPVAFSQIRIGDCVAYNTSIGKQAVHRVVGIKEDGLLTRGDALPVPDDRPVAGDQIIGRVKYRHRFGQKGLITRGLRGQFSGIFYRYAGRIDPNRPSRGGKLARGIRATSSTVFRMLSFSCVARTMKVAGGEKVIVWELKGRIIGRQDSERPEGLMAWPWSIFVQRPEKT